MILQTDSRLNKHINKYGCNFMSIAFLANKHGFGQFDTDVLERVYSDAVYNDIMDRDCYIKSYDRLFKMFGLSVKYTGEHEPPGKRCEKNQIELLYFEYPQKSWTHFVAGDGGGNIAYDPWGVSETCYHGQLVSKRIFTLI